MSDHPSSHVRRRHRVGSLLVALTLGAGLTVAGTTQAAAAPADCAALTAPIDMHGAASGKSTILTGPGATVDLSGYPRDLGVLLNAAVADADNLVPVRQLSRGADNLFVTAGSEADQAIDELGYRDEGVIFYAAGNALSCTVPVYRYRSNTIHRLAVTSADRSALSSAGWDAEGIAFYAAPASAGPPPTGDTRFTIAIEPDTQVETNNPSDPRFEQRNQWLVDHAGKNDLDLRFVSHTGDVVNWDTDDHAQYKVATAALKVFDNAGLPYSLSIGNHDTMATGGGNGGSARDPKNTSKLLRVTETFNSYFTASRYGAVGGAFEAGKVDNIYSEFAAGGARWLVLNLELWPRAAVVEWARDVVAAHPKSNVIVVTHSYLEDDGSISQSKSYGATSPQYLFDDLISRYANIRMVFSGHTGIATSRTDTGVHGNKIKSYLTAIHSRSTNPVRIVEIDTAADSVDTEIVAPFDDSNAWRSYDTSTGGMSWITGG